MGRPRRPSVEVDIKDVAQWAKTGATYLEISWRLGVSLSTLMRRLKTPEYEAAFLMGRGERCISLRAKQTQVALAGNVVMLKHLGCNDLGQTTSAHRFVDKQGDDKDLLPIDALREWIRGAPEDE